MRPIILFLLLVFVGCKPSTHSEKDNEEISSKQQFETKGVIKKIDTFFDIYKSSSSDKAIDFIFSTNTSLSSSQQLISLKAKLDSTRRQLGAFTGQELITQKSSSGSLILLSYLVKHEKQPLRFTFIFYKPQNAWMLYKFKFDDDTDTELEEAGKIYFIK